MFHTWVADSVASAGPRMRDPLAVSLVGAAQAIETGDTRAARAILHNTLRTVEGASTADQRLTAIFARSLLSRIDGDCSGAGNLYLRSAEPRDMLACFQLLVQASPLVRFGHTAACLAIAHTLRRERKIHIIDIGIGSGIQWLQFLELLAARSGGAPALRITGIDLPCAEQQPVRARMLKRLLEQRAAQLGISLQVELLTCYAEDLDLEALQLSSDEALAINAAFALHHLPAADAVSEEGRSRDMLLYRLRSLRPRILTLVEPDVEHNALPFVARIAESFRHYQMVFESLDTLLANYPTEREIIEQEFFGREILNIVAGEGTQRVERHERYEAWQRRLLRLGFELVPLEPIADELQEYLPLSGPCAVAIDRGALLLCWRQAPLIAASAWRPRMS